jgi:hypothetical protein
MALPKKQCDNDAVSGMNGLAGVTASGDTISPLCGFCERFYGIAEIAAGPIHILKFRGEAPPDGKNGANCWGFSSERRHQSGKSRLCHAEIRISA